MVFHRKSTNTITDSNDVPENSSSSTISEEAPDETSTDLKRRNANELITSPKK